MIPSFGHFTVLLLYLLLTYAKQGEDSIVLDDTIRDEDLYDVVLNISRFNSVLQRLKSNFNTLYKTNESQESTIREYDTEKREENSIGTGKLKNGNAETDLRIFQKKKIFLSEGKSDYGKIMQEKRENMTQIMKLRDNSNKLQLECKKHKGNMKNNTETKKEITKAETFPRNSIRHNITVNKSNHLQTQKEIVYIDKNDPGVRKQPSVLENKEFFKFNSQKYTSKDDERHNINSRIKFYPIHMQRRVDQLERKRMRNFNITGEPQIKKLNLEPEKSLIRARKTYRLLDSLENFRTESGSAEKLDLEMTYELTSTEEVGLNFFIVSNDDAKTDSLRRAYGNACLKTVVRKCYKGCLNATKRACRNVTCGFELRDRIKYVARSACIKEFLHGHQIKKNDSKDIKDDTMRQLIRSGYSDCACLYPPQGDANLHFKAGERPLNTLRDEFRSACREESSAKCEKACYYAVNTACSTFDCRRNLKKILKKACKPECKYAYLSKRKRKRRISSASSSGTSSRSDGDSQSSGSHSESENSGDEKPEQNTTITTTLTTPHE